MIHKMSCGSKRPDNDRQDFCKGRNGAALDFVFESPVFTKRRFVPKLVLDHGLSYATPNRFANDLLANGILSTVRPSSGRAPAILSFTPLLEIRRV